MPRVSSEALARYLDQLRRGVDPAEFVEAASSTTADDLSSILRVAASISPPESVSLDAQARSRIRTALVREIAVSKLPSTESWLRRVTQGLWSTLDQLPTATLRLQRATAVAIAFAVVFATTGT